MELLALTSAQVPLSYPLLARKRTRKPPFFFTFSDSSMSKGSLCKISEFLLGNEKTSLSDRIALRQCSGEKSIFFNNATNEILFGRKHCFYDLNIKMVHFCTFIMRLLWKLGKIAAILDSRRRKKRSQFWIFCYQIFNISKKLQYLQTYQRDFWNFEKKSIFLIFCQKWHKNMRFFIVFRIPFRN